MGVQVEVEMLQDLFESELKRTKQLQAEVNQLKERFFVEPWTDSKGVKHNTGE
jgi:hypothetical protein